MKAKLLFIDLVQEEVREWCHDTHDGSISSGLDDLFTNFDFCQYPLRHPFGTSAGDKYKIMVPSEYKGE